MVTHFQNLRIIPIENVCTFYIIMVCQPFKCVSQCRRPLNPCGSWMSNAYLRAANLHCQSKFINDTQAGSSWVCDCHCKSIGYKSLNCCRRRRRRCDDSDSSDDDSDSSDDDGGSHDSDSDDSCSSGDGHSHKRRSWKRKHGSWKHKHGSRKRKHHDKH